MTEILLTIICMCLIALIASREREHQKERERLLDRIMSKDIAEFKRVTETPKDEEEEKEADSMVAIDSPEAMEALLND